MVRYRYKRFEVKLSSVLLYKCHSTDEVALLLLCLAELSRKTELLADALFYSAVGHFRLGEYRACNAQLVELVKVDPLHSRGVAFVEYYKAYIRRRTCLLL